jgi:hypothetical protein
MKKLISALLCVVVILFIGASSAETPTPIKFSLWNRIALPQNDSTHGLEIGIGSYTPELKGIALNFIYVETDCGSGWLKAFVTLTKLFEGVQSGIVNLNSEKISGIQCGLFNEAKLIKGIQFGFINKAEDMCGVQIGLINFVKKGRFPVMIIVNAKF